MESKEKEKSNQCKCCGGKLDYRTASGGVIRCKYCGTSWTLPAFGLSAYVTAQLVSGDNNIDRGDFDAARICFEKAIEHAPEEPEAYFGLARAKLRVQFIVDKSGETPYIRPICHEISFKNFMEDPAYLKAVELATDEQREVYRAQGRAIDHIREEFYRLQKNGVDYDVFLCTKVSTAGTQESEGGKLYTAESHETLKLYYFLKNKNLKPFYSEVDAKDRTGEDYEALICYALLRSESMILVCFDEEYLDTPWVKNEYTRFAEMMKRGQKESGALTILYRDEKHRIERLPGIDGKIEGIGCDRPDAYSRVEAHIQRFRSRKASRKKTEEILTNANSAREEAALIKEQNEARRLELQAKKEKEKQDKLKRRHELAEQKAEEKQQRKLDLASRREERKRRRGEASKNIKGVFVSLFSAIGRGFAGFFGRLKDGSPLFMASILVFMILEIAGCLFAVSYPFANTMVVGTSGYIAYIAVLSVLAGILLLHGIFALIRGAERMIGYFIGLPVEGILAAICILIGWFCDCLHIWLWIYFGVGILVGFVIVIANWDGLDYDNGQVSMPIGFVWAFAIFSSLCGLLYTVQTQKTTADGFYYEILEDGTAGVGALAYDMEELVIPVEIDGYRVTQVSKPLSGRDNHVQSIIIPEGILRIGEDAFKGCSSLTEVRIAETVVSIGESAFASCTNLAEIRLPDSVREMGEGVFESCSRLVNVNIPTAIGAIPDACFKNCSALKEITIPDNIKSIYSEAFAGCITLEKVNLSPHSVWKTNYGFWHSDAFSADGNMADTIRSLTRDSDYTYDRTE